MRVRSFDIPQADRLESVVQVIINVGNGARTDVQIIQNIPDLTTDRQGRYYRRAAEILGFITNQNNYAQITPKGTEFIRNPTLTNPLFIASVLSIEVIQRLLPYIELYPNGLTKRQIENYLASIVSRNLGPTMLPRRVMTILSWLKTLRVIEQRDNRYYSINEFTQNLPIVEFDNIEQPILPTSGDLNEYQIVQERTREANEEVAYYRNEALHERARTSHIRLVNLVAQRIIDAGGIPKKNPLIDLAVNLEDNFIFEMKSTTDNNVRGQIRKGLSQLYEYRYLQNKPNANLVLVVENPLNTTSRWMLDYMESDREVLMIWDGNNQLYGSNETR